MMSPLFSLFSLKKIIVLVICIFFAIEIIWLPYIVSLPSSDTEANASSARLEIQYTPLYLKDSSISLPVFSQNVLNSLYYPNILDHAGALLYENALWPHSDWNSTKYLELFNLIASNLASSLQPQTILDLFSATGTLPLAIFLVFNFFFFLLSVIQCILIPFCCCCCCKARKSGYRKKSIIQTSVSVLFLLGGFIYLSCMTIIYSTQLSMTLNSVESSVINFFNSSANFTQTLVDASNDIRLSGIQAIPDLISLFNQLNYDSNVILPTLGPSYQNLKTDLDKLLLIGQQTGTALNISALLINQLQTHRSIDVQNLNSLSQSLQSFSTIQIRGINYNTPNPPNSNVVSSSLLPDLSNLPSLTSLQNQWNSANPSLAATISSLQSIYTSLPTILQGNISYQVNSSLSSSSNNITASINQVFSGFANGINPLTTNIYGISNTTKDTFDTSIKQADYIRSDVMKIVYFIFIGFCGIGCIGVVAQKGKCMYLVIPLVLILSIVFWLQFFIYFLVNFPINEVCRSKTSLLQSNYSLNPDLLITPDSILTSCLDNANVFNITLTSTNATLLQALNLSNATSFFQDSQPLIDKLPLNSFNSSLQSSLSNPFPNLTSTFNNLNQTLNLPPGFQFSAFQIPSPYSISSINANVSSFSTGLTPSSINPSFSTTSMNNKISNFNSLALSANSSWVAWTYNDVVVHFITNNEVFSASTYVTGSSSHPSNGAITSSFTSMFQDIQYNEAAIQAISQLQSSITSFQANLTMVLTPILNNLNTISMSMGAVAFNRTLLASLLANLTTQDEPSLTLAIPSFKSTLATYLFQEIRTFMTDFLQRIKEKISRATTCRSLAVSVLDALEVVCTTTRNTFNGLWMSVWLSGLNVFPALFFLFRASKQLGHPIRVVPVTSLTSSTVASKKKKNKKQHSNGTKEEKQSLRSAAMLEEEDSEDESMESLEIKKKEKEKKQKKKN